MKLGMQTKCKLVLVPGRNAQLIGPHLSFLVYTHEEVGLSVGDEVPTPSFVRTLQRIQSLPSPDNLEGPDDAYWTTAQMMMRITPMTLPDGLFAFNLKLE